VAICEEDSDTYTEGGDVGGKARQQRGFLPAVGRGVGGYWFTSESVLRL
jgi:hypothetical protein